MKLRASRKKNDGEMILDYDHRERRAIVNPGPEQITVSPLVRAKIISVAAAMLSSPGKSARSN